MRTNRLRLRALAAAALMAGAAALAPAALAGPGVCDGTVTATVTVRWDWSPLGKGYENVVSTDTHKVTMHFDKDGGLTSLSDPAGDVPAYTVG